MESTFCFRPLGNLDGPVVWIYELLSILIARIEPGFDRFRRARRPLLEPDDRLVGRLQTIIGYRQDGCEELFLVLVEYLDYVAVEVESRSLNTYVPAGRALPGTPPVR